MQLLPSGPGYLTMPNLRLFSALVQRAQHTLSLTSPYFVPDDSLLEAITTAAYRGVAVELFVSEQADQFMVGHAQASYYDALLEAGVRIYQYPKPTILHAKHFTVDDIVGIIGSSNMDYRSFGLDYEITLMSTGKQFVADLQTISDEYRTVSHEINLAEWRARPKGQRYIDNVMRLVSALQYSVEARVESLHCGVAWSSVTTSLRMGPSQQGREGRSPQPGHYPIPGPQQPMQLMGPYPQGRPASSAASISHSFQLFFHGVVPASLLGRLGFAGD